MADSKFAHYRTPSRDKDLKRWLRLRRQVLSYLAQGFRAPEIAGKLSSKGRPNTYGSKTLSPATVRSYMQRAYNELGVNTAAGAVYAAIREGIIACPCGKGE